MFFANFNAKKENVFKRFLQFFGQKKDVGEEKNEQESAVLENESLQQVKNESAQENILVQESVQNEMKKQEEHVVVSGQGQTGAHDQSQTDAHEWQTDAHEWQTGAHEFQTGAHEWQTGMHDFQTDAHEFQTDTHEFQTGAHEFQTDTHEVGQTGAHEWQTDAHEWQTGTHDFQTGAHEFQTDTHEFQTDTHEQSQTGAHEVGQTDAHEFQTDTHEWQTGALELDDFENYEKVCEILRAIKKSDNFKLSQAQMDVEYFSSLQSFSNIFEISGSKDFKNFHEAYDYFFEEKKGDDGIKELLKKWKATFSFDTKILLNFLNYSKTMAQTFENFSKMEKNFVEGLGLSAQIFYKKKLHQKLIEKQKEYYDSVLSYSKELLDLEKITVLEYEMMQLQAKFMKNEANSLFKEISVLNDQLMQYNLDLESFDFNVFLQFLNFILQNNFHFKNALIECENFKYNALQLDAVFEAIGVVFPKISAKYDSEGKTVNSNFISFSYTINFATALFPVIQYKKIHAQNLACFITNRNSLIKINNSVDKYEVYQEQFVLLQNQLQLQEKELEIMLVKFKMNNLAYDKILEQQKKIIETERKICETSINLTKIQIDLMHEKGVLCKIMKTIF